MPGIQESLTEILDGVGSMWGPMKIWESVIRTYVAPTAYWFASVKCVIVIYISQMTI
jgi:hypothetical protein